MNLFAVEQQEKLYKVHKHQIKVAQNKNLGALELWLVYCFDPLKHKQIVLFTRYKIYQPIINLLCTVKDLYLLYGGECFTGN